MSRTRKQFPTAQRLKAAAIQAGLSGVEIARQLGVAPTILYRWWYGDRAPTADRLVAYAQIVGKPVAYFYQPEGEMEQRAQELADLLVDWARLLMAGEEVEVVLDCGTGVPTELAHHE